MAWLAPDNPDAKAVEAAGKVVITAAPAGFNQFIAAVYVLIQATLAAVASL